MSDEYAKAVHDIAQASEASTVEELIASFARDPKAAARANVPAIFAAPPPLRLEDGKIRGPKPGNEVAPGQVMTQEWFVNAYVRDLARALHIDLMAPPGAYYRWTNDPDEPTCALARRLPPSVNSLSKRRERGLSVAEGPWLYGLNAEWCYFVSGYEVGRGSDGEPLLDVNTLGVAGEIMERQRVFEKFHTLNRGRLSCISREKGVKVVELFALLVGF